MKEELTTKMHMEFCLDDEERLELAAAGVYFDITKYGKTPEEALKNYGLTKEEYNANRPYVGRPRDLILE